MNAGAIVNARHSLTLAQCRAALKIAPGSEVESAALALLHAIGDAVTLAAESAAYALDTFGLALRREALAERVEPLGPAAVAAVVDSALDALDTGRLAIGERDTVGHASTLLWTKRAGARLLVSVTRERGARPLLALEWREREQDARHYGYRSRFVYLDNGEELTATAYAAAVLESDK